MSIENLTDNSFETTIIIAIAGVLVAQNLNLKSTDIIAIARVVTYFGESILTVGAITAAKEAEQLAQDMQEQSMETKNLEIFTDQASTNLENIQATINKLIQQNQQLQEQIWVLESKLQKL